MEKIFIFTAIVLLFAITTSCDNGYEMLTVIHPDGSCRREFTESADSAFMVGDTAKSNPFTFHLDSSFIVRWRYMSDSMSNEWPLESWKHDTTAEHDKPIVVVSKDFEQVEMLNKKNWFDNNEWKSIDARINFDKNFKWFYTYYNFSEAYPVIETFNKVSIDKYLSDAETKMWLQGDPDYFRGLNGIEIKERLDNVEKKFNQWMDRNIYEIYYQEIIDHLHLIDDPDITKEKLILMKDSIYKLHKKDEDFMSEFNTSILDSAFHTHAFTGLFEHHEEIEKKVDQELSFIDLFDQHINYQLIIPGKVLHTNAMAIYGDTLFWKINAYRFAMYDYIIKVKSRKNNVLIMIISALFVLFVILSVFLTVMRKCRKYEIMK